MLKILVLSQFYYPDITAAAFRIKETVDILAKNGHQVTVITALPHKSENIPYTVDDGNVTVYRLPIIKYTGGGRSDYILHYLSFMVNAIWSGIKNCIKPDLVWASSPPLFTAIAGFILARWTGAVFTLDIRDIWPDSAVSAGQLSQNSIVFRIAKIIEVFLYRRARFISCVARPMGQYIENLQGRKKLFVMYNGISSEYLNDDLTARSKVLHLINKSMFNVMYVGNMGHCQNLSMIIDAAKLLKAYGLKDVVIHLVGSGIERQQLINKITNEAVDNVKLYGPLPKNEAIELMKLADVLFLQLKDDETMEKTIPSKVFDYMVAGKPILFGIKGEGAEILGKIRGNLQFSSAQTESFVAAVKKLRENYTLFAELAKENRVYVEKYFVREVLVGHLEKRFIQAIL